MALISIGNSFPFYKILHFKNNVSGNGEGPGLPSEASAKEGVGSPNKPVIWYESFSYQADSWDSPRRVVAKVEWHSGELFPRVGFIGAAAGKNNPHSDAIDDKI